MNHSKPRLIRVGFSMTNSTGSTVSCLGAAARPMPATRLTRSNEARFFIGTFLQFADHCDILSLAMTNFAKVRFAVIATVLMFVGCTKEPEKPVAESAKPQVPSDLVRLDPAFDALVPPSAQLEKLA